MNLTVEQIKQNILDGEIIDRMSLVYLNEVLNNTNHNKPKMLVKKDFNTKTIKRIK